MSKVSTCLWFDDQGEQAAEYYTSIFPDSKIVEVTRYGDDAPGPTGSAMVVDFELFGQSYSALNGGPHFPLTEAVSIVVLRDDQDEVDHYWNRLVDGGSESQCGWLRDKFGLSWQIVPKRLNELTSDPDRVRANRVLAAMLKMKKLVVADLEDAYRG